MATKMWCNKKKPQKREAARFFAKMERKGSFMGVTLKWLLHESRLRGLKLLTCFEAESTEITGVNILDNPETLQWIKSGELVLTTGYIFRDDPSMQTQILKDLKSVGCAALCFKTKRFFSEIPAAMRQTAQQIGLPLIELPLTYSFAEISEEISRKLYTEQFAALAHEQVLYNALFNAYFQGRPLNEILRILSNYLARTVCILDGRRQIPWCAPTESEKNLGAQPLPLTLEKVLVRPAEPGRPYFTGELSFPGFTAQAAMLALSNPQYTLCILEPHPETLPWGTLEHVLKIIDFTRIHAGLRHPELTNYFDAFFQYLLHPDSLSETAAIQLFEYYGLPYAPRGICAAACARGHSPQDFLPRVKALLQKLGIAESGCFLAYNETLLCLCFLKPAWAPLKQNGEALRAQLARQLPELSVGVGRLLPGPLPQGFREASFALSLAENEEQGQLLFFQDHLVDWQASKLSEEEQKDVLALTIQPLLDFDAQNHTNLVQTLQAYFESCRNASLAAAKLYIHRNTFLKRMDKIRSLIDFPSDNPDRLASIDLGLRIYRGLPHE